MVCCIRRAGWALVRDFEMLVEESCIRVGVVAELLLFHVLIIRVLCCRDASIPD